MKGVVFNLLESMVEEKFGLAAWDEILEKSDSDGIYIASSTYPDAELMSIVATASEMTGIPADALVRSFGAYMAPGFKDLYPVFFDSCSGLKEFLLTVDGVIHVEVRKLYPDAGTPEFSYSDEQPDKLTMTYRSPRKLCLLAEGLIEGTAAIFDEKYTMDHTTCMHRDADHCELALTFG